MSKLVTNTTFKFLFLIGIALITENSFARELYSRAYSVRALGMGGAYSPLARGVEALFFNPAGLAQTKEITLTALKLRVGASGTEAYEDAQDFDGDDLASTLRNFYGDNIWLGGGATSGFSTPNFAAALYDNFNVSADLSNPALPSFELDYVNDYGVAVGLGLDLGPNLAAGFVVKRITRMGASLELPVSSIAELDSDALMDELDNEGLGYSLDFGTSMTFPSPVSPTLSFVMKDIGDTSFKLSDGVRRPPTDYSEMIAGLSLDISVPGMSIIPVVEMTHIAADEEIHIGKKVNFGVEVDLPGLDLRGGMHQGYWTAGVGLNLGIIEVDVASYGVELGEYPGQHEDRRYVLELTIDFGFDPANGVFLGLNKENRKRLKQRR